jgi:transcriptional regulator with XRE-family HTH domain
MTTDEEWAEKLKRLLKAELKRKGISYKELAEKLGELGIADTEANIKNKVSRAGFSAVYLLQCLTAIGCQTLDLREI